MFSNFIKAVISAFGYKEMHDERTISNLSGLDGQTVIINSSTTIDSETTISKQASSINEININSKVVTIPTFQGSSSHVIELLTSEKPSSESFANGQLNGPQNTIFVKLEEDCQENNIDERTTTITVENSENLNPTHAGLLHGPQNGEYQTLEENISNIEAADRLTQLHEEFQNLVEANNNQVSSIYLRVKLTLLQLSIGVIVGAIGSSVDKHHSLYVAIPSALLSFSSPLWLLKPVISHCKTTNAMHANQINSLNLEGEISRRIHR